MDPRAKVCSQVKLEGGKMGGKKTFGKFLFLPNDCLKGKADMRSRIETAQVRLRGNMG